MKLDPRADDKVNKLCDQSEKNEWLPGGYWNERGPEFKLMTKDEILEYIQSLKVNFNRIGIKDFQMITPDS